MIHIDKSFLNGFNNENDYFHGAMKAKRLDFKKIVEDVILSGERELIDVDIEVLDCLLFDKVVINKEKNIVAKVPALSGEFLKHVDLSKVDFTNVCWGDYYSLPRQYDNLYDDIGDPYFVSDHYRVTDSDKFKNNFAGTNASIDLTQSFEARYFGVICLEKCNFRGLDFNNQDLSSIQGIKISSSDVSNTGLNIPNHLQLEASSTDLSGINLSSRTINGAGYLDYCFTSGWAKINTDKDLANCNLNNTGIKINYDYESMLETVRNDVITNKNFYGHTFEGVLKLKLDGCKKLTCDAFNNKWQGCFVNGQYVNSIMDNGVIQLEEEQSSMGRKF